MRNLFKLFEVLGIQLIFDLRFESSLHIIQLVPRQTSEPWMILQNSNIRNFRANVKYALHEHKQQPNKLKENVIQSYTNYIPVNQPIFIRLYCCELNEDYTHLTLDIWTTTTTSRLLHTILEARESHNKSRRWQPTLISATPLVPRRWSTSHSNLLMNSLASTVSLASSGNFRCVLQFTIWLIVSTRFQYA